MILARVKVAFLLTICAGYTFSHSHLLNSSMMFILMLATSYESSVDFNTFTIYTLEKKLTKLGTSTRRTMTMMMTTMTLAPATGS